MKHHDCKQRLSAYVAGELDAGGETEVRGHLSECADCAREHELVARGAALASMISPADAPPHVWNAIGKALDSRRDPETFAVRHAWDWRALAFVGGFAVVLSVIVGLSLRTGVAPNASAPTWNVSVTNGEGRVAPRTLAVGETLETGTGSSAVVEVPRLGSVEVAPNSALRLVRESADEKRLALDRGSLSARIFAPPRVFVVDTPSAAAIDLGCIYDLDIDEAGNTRLHVTGGVVVLESRGEESKVPAGAIAVSKKDAGLGTPFAEGASEPFRTALERFDFGSGGDEALDVVLKEARRDDVLSLWHLLRRVPPASRGRVYDALVARIERPESVTREKAERLDEATIERLWEAVALYWFSRVPPPPQTFGPKS